MAGAWSGEKRVAHIQALLAEIGAQSHIASHLLKSVVRAFYDFLTVAFLTAGVIMAVRGRDQEAAIWGGLGVLLALGWVVTKLAANGMTRMVQMLREEWNRDEPDEAPAVVEPEQAGAPPSPEPKRRPEPFHIRPRSLHGH